MAVNPKSLSYCIITADTNDPTDLRSKSPMVHDYVGQPGFKKANVPRSVMDKGEADRRRTKRKRGRTTSSKKTTRRSLQHVQHLVLQLQLRSLPVLAWYPLLNLFLNLRLTLMPATLELPRKHLVPGQRKMTSSFAA